MARLEIPSIVVHKGCSRSLSRSSSPTGVTGSVMPALPSAKHAIAAISSGTNSVTYTEQSDREMVGGNVNVNVDSKASEDNMHSNPPEKADLNSNHFRNRTNPKVKLLRSHAMRESTSPPREAHNSGSTSPRSSLDSSEKSISSTSLSLSTLNSKFNNNESIFNSNLSAQSPQQTRTTATSPTCRTPTRNARSSLSPNSSPKSTDSPVINEKDSNQCLKATSPHITTKCNNCVKNNQNDRPGLLQTPISPSKIGTIHSPKNSNQCYQNSREQRKPNTISVCNNQCMNQCSNSLSVRSSSRSKLRHLTSHNSHSLDSNISPCLSRDSSTECYTDSTGIDLEQFIAVTINRNQKDRSVLLKIEKELIEFAKDRQKVCHRFPNMSSYNRMLVHRVAAYFGMEHNVDQSGLSVIVTRTKNMRVPDTRFKEHIRDELLLAEEPRRSILKRDSSSFEDGFNFKSPDRMSGDYRRSKSFEEREEEYEKARRRIFKDSSGESSELTSWPYWSSSESSDASARYRLLHPGDQLPMRQRLAKGDSCDGRESFRGVLRPSVSKSFSFEGYTRGMLSRGDSVTSTRSASARLTKQDSGVSVCSRLSPSSSGYKSQSQRSDATISPSPSPSPIPTTPCSHVQGSSPNSTSNDGSQGNQTVMWAISSIESVPPGSIIMNPRTNQPYTNSDGSIYRFDPENPPKIFSNIAEIHECPSTTQSEKFPSLPESPRITLNKPTNSKRENLSKSSTNNRVKNTATSPTLPCSASPPLLIPESPHKVVKTSDSQGCPHNGLNQTWGNYSHQGSTESYYNHSTVYPVTQRQSPTLQRQPEIHSGQQQGVLPSTEIVLGQHNIYGNYSMAMHQGTWHPQAPPEVPDLTGYFMGMNVYEQSRSGIEAQGNSTYNFNLPPQGNNGQNYWQSTPPPPHPPPVPPVPQQHGQPMNAFPPQHAMYFLPQSNTAANVGQTGNERPSMHHQHQRFTSSYTYNPQTMAQPNQTVSNYVNGYSISYNPMLTVTPNPTDYSCQNQLHMIPSYYSPGQSGIPPPPVLWRVPTPPTTPTSNQIPGVPIMYVNSGTYGPPGMLSGPFGHQLQNTGTSGPPGAYIASSVLPNLVFRQNMPMVATGIRASTPSGSQRTSRSPTPAHEPFNNYNTINGNGGNGNAHGGTVNGDNRNTQAQSRYPVPMQQGLHIVQGDIRLMHPSVTGNARLQHAPMPSPPVLQGCPRPFRPPSYSSNASGCPTPNSFDGRNQKMRKQREGEGNNLSPKSVGTILINGRNEKPS